MPLIPYEPFKDIEEFFNDEHFFPSISQRKTTPEMDVYETEDSVVAEVSTPGMTADDLNVSVDGNVLKIRGEKEVEEEDKKEERGYYRKEIRRGAFERAVRLPSNINSEEIKATHEDGILKVEIPKAEEEIEEGRQVEIESK